MTTKLFTKPLDALDDSNGSIKVTHNKAMQSASQTIESPASAKKAPPPKRFGLLAVLAIGVDAAASFLKSKIEKAAALASQVGAAVLKSKKAVSAASTAVLGDIQPKPQKIAANRLAKGKARLASALLFALLIASFIASPNGMAFILPETGPLPYYEKEKHYNVQAVRSIPFIVDLADYYNDVWTLMRRFNSEVFSPAFRELFGISGVTHYCLHNGESMWEAGFYETIWYASGGGICTRYWKDKNGQAQQRPARLEVRRLVNHSQVGKKITIETATRTFTGRLELVTVRTTEEWKCPFFTTDTSVPPTDDITNDLFGDILVHIRTFFRARYEDEGLNGDIKDWEYVGECESTTVTSPGPEVIHTPCVPSNMSMPENGCITYSLIPIPTNLLTPQ